MILTDSMLDAAFRFRETEPWKELTDSNIFAVRTDSGETAYCSIMGHGGQHYSLGIYIGEKGFSTYLRSLTSNDDSTIDNLRKAVAFDCINCDFMQAKDIEDKVKKVIRRYAENHGEKIPRKHGWIDFTRHTPYKGQWCITDSNDARIAEEVLRAATFFARESQGKNPEDIGLDPLGGYPTNRGGKKIPMVVRDADGYSIQTTVTPPFVEQDYAAPEFCNDILIHRLKGIKRTGDVACRLEHIPMPVQPQHGNEPVMPGMFIIIKQSDGYMLPPLTTTDYKDAPENVPTQIANHFCELGINPRQIKVNDMLTFALLRNLCKACDIELKLEKQIPDLDDACICMIGEMMFGSMW